MMFEYGFKALEDLRSGSRSDTQKEQLFPLPHIVLQQSDSLAKCKWVGIGQ